jgi:hypothetical protein
MEHWLKNKFPGQVKDGEMLGTFISSVRNADPSSPLASARVILEDLEDINGFSKRYHHADNPRASAEPIDDTELASFVKRTLEVAAGKSEADGTMNLKTLYKHPIERARRAFHYVARSNQPTHRTHSFARPFMDIGLLVRSRPA